MGSNLTGDMDVCRECCVLSGRGPCDTLMTRREESYRLRCVVVYVLENRKNAEAMAHVGPQRHGGGIVVKEHCKGEVCSLRKNLGNSYCSCVLKIKKKRSKPLLVLTSQVLYLEY